MDKTDEDHAINWFTIAKRDLDSARKLASEPDPYLDTAIYHCQQAAEKAVKGFLVFHNREFPKTHDVRKVAALAEEVEPGFAAWLSAAELLTPYATVFRYTDDILEPSQDEFDEAIGVGNGHLYLRSLVASTGNPSEALTEEESMPEGQQKGRVAIVTGAARGIGRAIAERLLADGHRVAIVDRDGPAANAAAQALGEKALAVTCDLTDSAAVNAMIWHLHATWGRVDILVNNAGIVGPNKPLTEIADDEWAQVLAINLTGVFNCCRAAVPQMLANDWGRIVNIASIAGKEGNPRLSAYSATKAAVIGLTKSLGKELATTNVRVNCVTPAVIETEILAQMTQETIDYMVAKIPMGRPGKVTEVAALVSWLASDECSFSTAAVFDVSGGRATY